VFPVRFPVVFPVRFVVVVLKGFRVTKGFSGVTRFLVLKGFCVVKGFGIG